jgi:hypothetical protein
MDILTIATEAGKERLRVEIHRVNPQRAYVAIMQALNDLPQERKTRKDKGTKRTKTLPPAAKSP